MMMKIRVPFEFRVRPFCWSLSGQLLTLAARGEITLSRHTSAKPQPSYSWLLLTPREGV
jgi:hypothetical protein